MKMKKLSNLPVFGYSSLRWKSSAPPIASGVNAVVSKPEFAVAKHGRFTQEPPTLGNQFLSDPPLKSFLRRHIPQDVCLKLKLFL